EVCGNGIDDNCNGQVDESPTCDVTNADLIVSAITVLPANALPGSTVNVADTTKNQGTGTAGDSATKFYFSTDASYSAGDIYLGSRTVPTLAGGATSSENTSVIIPSSVTCPDSYYIVAVSDADNNVVDTNETNNVKSFSIKIGADLIVSSFSAPTTAARGQSISISDTTRNQGAGTAGASTTKYFLSKDTIYNPWDTYLNGRTVAQLAASTSDIGNPTSVTIPAGLSAGKYYIIAISDANGDVPESAEANNNKTKQINITQ
ncbi:MAG: peptidase S8, partial [Nitrospirae bacterium]|nr:peptidase S8 [Nitrospirota bacterium]